MDDSESPQGREMLQRAITEVVGTPIPPTVETWPLPRKPVGPNAHPEKFKSVSKGNKGHTKQRGSSRGHGKVKKRIFAGWD